MLLYPRGNYTAARHCIQLVVRKSARVSFLGIHDCLLSFEADIRASRAYAGTVQLLTLAVWLGLVTVVHVIGPWGVSVELMPTLNPNTVK